MQRIGKTVTIYTLGPIGFWQEIAKEKRQMENMKEKLGSRIILRSRHNREGSIDARGWIVTIVLALVAILIGVSLLTTIQDTVDNSTATGATRSMLDLLPLIVAVGLLLLVVGAFVMDSGLINRRD